MSNELTGPAQVLGRFPFLFRYGAPEKLLQSTMAKAADYTGPQELVYTGFLPREGEVLQIRGRAYQVLVVVYLADEHPNPAFVTLTPLVCGVELAERPVG